MGFQWFSCIQCNNHEYENKKRKVEQEYKNSTFYFIMEVTECTKCGYIYFNDDQADVLYRKTKAAYEKQK